MKIGKVPENVLKRSVMKQLHYKRDEVILGPGIGEDCAALALAEDEILVMSTDPITGTAKDIGKLAIQITANDLASAGSRADRCYADHTLAGWDEGDCPQTHHGADGMCMQGSQNADSRRTYGSHRGGKPTGGQCRGCRQGEERKSDLYRRSQGGHGYCRQ